MLNVIPLQPKKAPTLLRPFATHYFTNPNDTKAAEISHGACSTEQGAIRASVVRLFLGQYGRCQIVDRESGAVIYTVKRNMHGLHIRYGSDVPFKVWNAKKP